MNELEAEVINSLEEAGFKPWLYTRAKTGSLYYKFDDPALRSLTIRDHHGYKKYKYKWNIVKGYKGPRQTKEDGITRFWYNEEEIPEFIQRISQYQTTINYRKGGVII